MDEINKDKELVRKGIQILSLSGEIIYHEFLSLLWWYYSKRGLHLYKKSTTRSLLDIAIQKRYQSRWIFTMSIFVYIIEWFFLLNNVNFVFIGSN